MKKNQLIKALVFTAVLAAFPAAGLTASAEDAVVDLAVNDGAAVAAKAEDVVLAPAVEAAPVEVAPVVVEAAPVVEEAAPAVEAAPAPAVDEAAPVVAEGTKNGKEDKCDPDTKKTVEVPAAKPATAPSDTAVKATMDDVILKAGNDTKIHVDVTPGTYDTGKVDANGNKIYEKYKTGVRYFSSDNSIATVDADGTVHAKKAGKVTIYVETLEGTKEITLNVSESYNVLLIDRTDSTNGKGLAKEKAAAISFSEEVLKVNSESHIAVVQIGDQRTTKTLASFTNDLKDIKNTINGITAGSEYSVYSAGLKEAGSLLNSIPAYNQGLNKNVVIFGDGACTYGDRTYAQEVAQNMINNDRNLTIYTMGVYDSSTDAEKKEGADFLKSIGRVKKVDDKGNVIKINDKEVVEDHYYEINNVADMKDTFKQIATRPTLSAEAKTVSFAAFDTVVYGKDCGKKCGCNSDCKKGGKKSNANSPETADSSSIYVIALFALLGAGAMGVSAKKRFED